MRNLRLLAALSILVLLVTASPAAAQCAQANRTVHADVVAIDQLIMLNRLGASIPEGMVFALKTDVVAADTTKPLGPGNAVLRPGKRPRPIVLRVNQYDCLQITFTNWLSTTPVNQAASSGATTLQTATRNASIHVNGMQVTKISDDGSYVGANATSLVAPGSYATYNVYASEQGTFLLYSMGAVWGGSGTPNGGAQQTEGLFGAVNVEPPDAEWYRSQVTQKLMKDATIDTFPSGQPRLDYNQFLMYTKDASDKNRTLISTDLTAVITGANRGPFNPSLVPCNDPSGPGRPPGCTATTNPNFALNYAEPFRTEPFREFTIIYHELMEVTQALSEYYAQASSSLATALNPIQDQFAINYGTGGIGSEILANRFGIGPEGGCPDCKYEEFFLDSWAAGDPAMVVDTPANAPCTAWTLYSMGNGGSSTCAETQGGISSSGYMVPKPKAHYALYPDDPSNVYHSYLNDHVKFRVLHGGTAFSHVHHQHAHQWLRTPNNNESTYLDSQLINPGSAYTLEMTFGGSGNRNHTPGDSIFHCHFYPHFAGGMWSLWRVHDTFEPGTLMNGDVPASGYSRALPDAEILAGTPTPALVPVPTIPMAPMPARVGLVTVNNPDQTGVVIGTAVQVQPDDLKAGINPGYPFFIPGISGVRAPHPPLDFANESGKSLDGGLPRHIMLTGSITNQEQTQYDFSKDLGKINALQLPEGGTQIEQIAMKYHEKCFHDTFTPDGQPRTGGLGFATNGLPRTSGAPYADPAIVPYNPNKPPANPCVALDPNKIRHYKAAVFQTDLVFNKEGWHYPQARMLSLWSDVMPTLSGQRPPQPLFFRVNSDEAAVYWHTNLVPDYYQLDDFQVRTPTDIIGQHIHLVKFDVTASDGASNGFNYEDGTFSPDEVRARISSIKQCNWLLQGLPAATGGTINPPACGSGTRGTALTAQAPPTEICTSCPADWMGAQTTVQRWMADPLKSPAEDPVIDRTLRTVFTHDHFGPSTHQQTGLYAAFVIEPKDTVWLDNESGTKMGTRTDGGPTSWQAVIRPAAPPYTDANTFREFALALQDFQLTYGPKSITQQNPPPVPGQGVPAINCNPGGTPPTTQCGWADPFHVLNQSNTSTGAVPSFAGMQQQGVSAGPTQGTYTFNYRNEPLPYRLQKGTGTTDARATDPSYVFRSDVPRNNSATLSQPAAGAPIDPAQPNGFKFPLRNLTNDLKGGDPYTPMLRAYEKDNVQIRVIVGAHMLPHPFTVQGIKWFFEPGDALTVAAKLTANAAATAKVPDIVEQSILGPADLKDNSGYRSTQAMGISEHFEFLFHVPHSQTSKNGFTDFLYMPDSSNPPNIPGNGGGRGLQDGMWGIMRAYDSLQTGDKALVALPNNQPPSAPPPPVSSDKPAWWATACTQANTKSMTLTAQNVSITFNSGVTPTGQSKTQPVTLSTALAYGLPNNSTTVSNISNGVALEPAILHANAGDCLQVTLINGFSTSNSIFSSTTQTAGYASNSAFNYVAGTPQGGNTPKPEFAFNASTHAGLNPALLGFDVSTSGGTNIGFNQTDVTVPPTSQRTYYWYAGHLDYRNGKAIPAEFGAVNIMPSDPIQQDTYGLVAGLVIEPPNTVFCHDPNTNAQGTVYAGSSCSGTALFREFDLVTQDNVAVPNAVGGNNVQVALNYKMEPMWPRFNNPSNTNTIDLSPAFSNSAVSNVDPQTPIFTAKAGMPVRIQMFHPGGASDQQVFAIHGHIWQDEPFLQGSTVIGTNPDSQWIGARDLYGANMSYTIVIPSAGGFNKVPGDYLYRTHPANFLSQGLWGIIRVQ